MKNKILNYLLVVILLAFFVGQCFFSLLQKNATIDEFTHISAGYSYWKSGQLKLNPEHPPFLKLYASAPLLLFNLKDFTKFSDFEKQNQREYARRFLFSNTLSFEKIVNISRLPIIFLGIILGLYVYFWSKELWGIKSGLFALFLYSFSPNIIAHSYLVTTDFGVAAFIFISCYYLWKYFKNEEFKYYAIISGFFLGLANISKFTALYILPIFLLFFIINFFIKRKDESYSAQKSFILGLIPIYLAVFIMIWAVYLPFQELEAKFSLLPQKYLEGLSDIQKHAEEGHESFFFGEIRDTGWWWYYLGSYAIKTPIPEMIFLLIAMFISIKKRDLFSKNYIVWLTPIYIIFITSIINKANIGFRHVLPMLLFLLVFESQVINFDFWKRKFLALLIFIISFWYFTTSLWIFPDYLMYFNQFVNGPDGGWRYSVVGDDWGQDVKGLKEYLKKNNIIHFTYDPYGRPDGRIPSSYFENEGIIYDRFECAKKPENSLLAVHITYMQRSGRCFGWLSDYRPIAKIGYTIFIYDFRKK